MFLFKPLQIKVRRICKDNPLPVVIPKGDWIDLRTAETVTFKAPETIKVNNPEGSSTPFHFEVVFDIKTIHLGVAMKLPDGCEAHLVSRSSTGKGMGISLINGIGIIDGDNPIGFSGDNDEWRYPAVAWRKTTLIGPHNEAMKDNEGNIVRDENGEVCAVDVPGERFCQFRVVLSQKATFMQKLRWMLARSIEIVEVDHLDGNNRGGGCIRVDR